MARLATEFPQVEGLTYLDHAASTLYSKSQVEAVSRELTSTLVANPHSGGRSSEEKFQLIWGCANAAWEILSDTSEEKGRPVMFSQY